MEFKTKRELIEYLKNNLYTTNFINTHTRPQLIEILKSLYLKTNFTRSMCKERQIKHIEFWLKLHNED